MGADKVIETWKAKHCVENADWTGFQSAVSIWPDTIKHSCEAENTAGEEGLGQQMMCKFKLDSENPKQVILNQER